MLSSQALAYGMAILQVKALTRIFGPAHFGMIGFSQILSLAATVFVSFGVNNTGIHAYRRSADIAGRSAVAWNQFSAQAVLTFVFSLVTLALTAIPTLQFSLANAEILIVSSLTFLLFPSWILAATGRFRTLSLWNVAIRGASLALIVIFVHRDNDLILALCCILLTSVLPVLIATPLLFRQGEIIFIHPRYWRPMQVLRNDFFVGCSNYFVFIYMYVPVLGGRIVLGSQEFGLFMFADRFRSLANTGISTVGSVLFNRFSGSFSSGAPAVRRSARISLAAIVSLGAGGAIVLAAFSRLIVLFFATTKYSASDSVLCVLALSLPLIGLNFFLTNFLINISGHSRRLMVVLFAITAISILLILAGLFGSAIGFAWLIVGTELVRATLSVLLLRHVGIDPLRPRPEDFPVADTP